MTPYYQDTSVTIYHGDYEAVLGDAHGAIHADAMLTDPPYGVGKAAWDSQFLLPAIVPCDALGLMPGVWNIARCPHQLLGLEYRWTLSAHLTNGMTHGAIGWGNWIPCLLYSRPDTSLFKQETDCKAFTVGLTIKELHPSPKPLSVVRWFLSRLPGKSVLDPFMGSGTTLRAAKDLGRKAIGIDINEGYCEMAAKRQAQEVLGFPETLSDLD